MHYKNVISKIFNFTINEANRTEKVIGKAEKEINNFIKDKANAQVQVTSAVTKSVLKKQGCMNFYGNNNVQLIYTILYDKE